MRRFIVGLVTVLALMVGFSSQATAAPERPVAVEAPAAPAHTPLRVIDVCVYVLEASDYGPTFNVDSTDIRLVHYGDFHVYQCAARYIYGSSSSYSLCYQWIMEYGSTHFWGTRPRGQCN